MSLWLALGSSVLAQEPLAAKPAKATAFSALVEREMATAQGEKRKQLGRLYVGPLGIRTEAFRGSEKVVVIHRRDLRSVWMLFPARKVYWSQPLQADAFPPLPDDPRSPCQTDLALSCQLEGTQSLDGRETERWRVNRVAQQKVEPLAQLWVDRALGVVIAERYADGAQMRMRRIAEGLPPPALFELPSGYTQEAMPSSRSQQPAGSSQKTGVRP
ncbi:hypothetical protein MAIT1_00198 [Magnetofaba australis IT-1]|uniref:DUF4412 domain-containing protein n=2 Tax=Magnetofaba TaxID=1472292 RepID=A0A1Y2K856_9PROT|nr:hypothetical protein MAIT1_00198 [Magnetofaba australis IT-1]